MASCRTRWHSITEDSPAPRNTDKHIMLLRGIRWKTWGLHKQGLRRSHDTPVLTSSPINYQCGLITWLITALNCLCSHGSTAIFPWKLWTQWKVWQSWWLMACVLLRLLICTGHGRDPWRWPSVWWLQCTHLVTHSSPKRSRIVE